MRKKDWTLIPVLSLLLASTAQAVYLRDIPRTFRQPDGTQLQCFLTGDEFHRRLHDAEGYTIIRNPATGYFVYADRATADRQGDDSRYLPLFPSSLVAGVADPAAAGLESGLDFVPEPARREQAQRRRLVLDESCRTPTTGTFNNLIVFIRFSDQASISEPFSFFDGIVNGGSGNTQNVYYDEVSDGQLDVQTDFYPEPAGETVNAYVDPQVRDYYRPYDPVDNPVGYADGDERKLREHTLLRDAVDFAESQIPVSPNLDMDGDGQVDNVNFVIQGDANSGILWPHWWVLDTYTVEINGLRVWEYDINLVGYYETGVLCHEFGHTLGLPDLYIYEDNPFGHSPVSVWDIMASTADPPQHMSAYQKWHYLGWTADYPELTVDGTYSLYPLSTQPFEGFRIPSPYSGTEYFAVEYRRDEGTFESSLPGSGLIVHRINTLGDGNEYGPWEIYVYRPGVRPPATATRTRPTSRSNQAAPRSTTSRIPTVSSATARPAGWTCTACRARKPTSSSRWGTIPSTPGPAW